MYRHTYIQAHTLIVTCTNTPISIYIYIYIRRLWSSTHHTRRTLFLSAHNRVRNSSVDGAGAGHFYMCDAVCCSVLQCVVVCCGVSQSVVLCCSVCSVVCCSVCSLLMDGAGAGLLHMCVAMCCNVLQCVAMCCNVLQCVAMCCNVLQRVVVCCGVS